MQYFKRHARYFFYFGLSLLCLAVAGLIFVGIMTHGFSYTTY